ncbi:MAG: hypothetical protein COS41_06810 [Elusimicrobia bacterium CG03_land_8_20_14_0_80_50_18]|nr:MAG: hypothetical protein COS41_06810 [Elusimicrobia bacterium CG03_land_8_20_14_0_80_50_18]
MKESVGSLKAYLIIAGLISGFSGVLTILEGSPLGIINGVLAVIILGKAFTLEDELRAGGIVLQVVFYILIALNLLGIGVGLIVPGVIGIIIVPGVIGIIICSYLIVNIRRLAKEAAGGINRRR